MPLLGCNALVLGQPAALAQGVMGKGSPQADPQHQHEQWGEAEAQHFGKESLTAGDGVRRGEEAEMQDAREDEPQDSGQDPLNFRCRGA